MKSMLIQTQWAINTLKAAGLPRKAFRVRVTRTKVGEYGDPAIRIFLPIAKLLPYAEKLATSFKVVQYLDHGNVIYMAVEVGKPGISRIDIAK